MSQSTRYRVCLEESGRTRSYVTGLEEATGRPLRWLSPQNVQEAGQYDRSEAEATAQRLADYLDGYPTAGRRVASQVRIVPVTGGFTYWLPCF